MDYRGMIICFEMNKSSSELCGTSTSGSSLMSIILYPGQNDVKFGRGGDTNYHIGNSRFRYFVNQYKQRYQAASREERQTVVQEIIDAWRSQDPPGRFLTRSNPSGSDRCLWHDVGNEMAFKKTIKVLGEGLGAKRLKPSKGKGTPSQSQNSKRKSSGALKNPAPGPSAGEVGVVEGNLLVSTVAVQRGLPEGVATAHLAPSASSDGASFPISLLVDTRLAHQSDQSNAQYATMITQMNRVKDQNEPGATARQAPRSCAPEESASDESSVPTVSSTTRPRSRQEYPPVAASLTDVFSCSNASESEDD